jgi:glycosyltransferase involved in cell wall biosynthesis
MRYFVHDFAGHPFQIQLSRELARQGHYVIHCYPTGLPGPKGRLAKSTGDSNRLSIVSIPLSGHFRKYSPLRRILAQRKYARDLIKAILAEAPDVVMSGNTPIDIQAQLLWSCRKHGIGFVHWVQDVYFRAVDFFLRRRLGLFSKVGSVPFQFIERAVTLGSDAVIVISSGFLPLLAKWNVAESKVTLIENWAPLDEIPSLPRQNAWSESQGLGKKLVLLYSGTLGLKHRPDLIYLLAKELPGNCQLVVVTDGIGQAYLQSMPAIDNLRVLGFQPYERVPEVLASADILLATLEADAAEFAVPSKILSYLCAGRPILLAGPKNNLGAIIVEHSKAGIVVDPNDTEAWVSGAEELIANPAYRGELGRNGRHYAEKTFDITKIACSFDRVLASSLRKSATESPAAPLPVSSKN